MQNFPADAGIDTDGVSTIFNIYSMGANDDFIRIIECVIQEQQQKKKDINK